jgi:hypothetical protein
MQLVLSRRGKQLFLAALSLCLMSLSLLPSCKKEEDSTRVLSTRDKILGTWRRNLRAYDHNANGVVDSSELVTSAIDTIILTLVPDASYTRIQRFKGIDYPENGTWHFQTNDAQIVFQPSTSTSRVDTFLLDTVSQAFFLMHTSRDSYYQGFVRPN